MQLSKQSMLSNNDKVSTTITITVKVNNLTGSAVIGLDEYEFVKSNSSIDLIYDTVEKLALELQRGI